MPYDINPKRPPQTLRGWRRTRQKIYMLPEQNWRIDRKALKAAAEFLELSAPVSVTHIDRYYANSPNCFGYAAPLNSWWNHGTAKHKIYINPLLPVNYAAAVVWHELTHCKQFERDCHGFYASQDKYAYDESPFEHEACLSMANVKWCQPCI